MAGLKPPDNHLEVRKLEERLSRIRPRLSYKELLPFIRLANIEQHFGYMTIEFFERNDMSVSAPVRFPKTDVAPSIGRNNDDVLFGFVKGLCVGAFILLLGFIAGTVSASLNPPPVEYVPLPLSYDCTTDSECEGL
jgi:hypothetical protein